MDAYIGIEGYTLPTGFIAKELTVIFPNTEYTHYLFERPANFVLSQRDEKTVRYATRYLNNLIYADGDIDILDFLSLDIYPRYYFSNIYLFFYCFSIIYLFLIIIY